jgi:hypothetical protein
VPFSQPARTNTQHEDNGFPEAWFPFSTATLEDPLTKAKGSVLRGDGSDPKLIETNTSTEYWQKGASLLTTDPLGMKDVALPDNCRAYMIAGTQHGGRAGAPHDPGPNVNPRNPHNPMPAVRALLVALEEWVVSGKAPPSSRVPTLADGTLVEPDKTGFPDIPGAAVVRRTNAVAPAKDWVKPCAGRARLSHAGLPGRSRRQRGRRHPPARHRRAARGLHRLERVQAAVSCR